MTVPARPKPIGLVLCGGRSRRMGADKGLLTLDDGRTWAKHAARVLEPLCERIAYSINPEQEREYRRADPGVELWIDGAPTPGPLGALLTAAGRDRDLLVLAVDMTAFVTELFSRLMAVSRDDDDAVLYRGDYGLEPLCGYYRRGGLAQLVRAVDSGRLDGSGLQQLPRLINVHEVAIQSAEREYFRNRNRPED